MFNEVELKPSRGQPRIRPASTLGELALRFGRVCLIGFPLAANSLGGTAAWAGCNSGNTAADDLLSSGNCEAEAHGIFSVAIGLFAKADGDESVAIGKDAGEGGSPDGIVAVGGRTSFIGVGAYSTAVGFQSQAVGNFSVAVGGGDVGAGDFGAQANGAASVAIGHFAISTGIDSVSLGELAGQSPDAGNEYNTALGAKAGSFVKGDGNTFAGLAAGYQVQGDLNNGFGNSAGEFVTGVRNVAVGTSSGQYVKGSYNATIGDTSGSYVTGNNNIALGHNAGRNIKTANSISIGTGAVAKASGSAAIGYNSVADIANTLSVGNSSLRRRIVNVAAAVNGTDAVNLAQMQAFFARPATVQADPEGIAELRSMLRAQAARISELERQLDGLKASHVQR